VVQLEHASRARGSATGRRYGLSHSAHACS
jgi:hypothetical protein